MCPWPQAAYEIGEALISSAGEAFIGIISHGPYRFEGQRALKKYRNDEEKTGESW